MNDTDPAISAPSPLLTPHQVGALLRVDARTIANWRWSGKGPAYVRSGSRALYKLADVQAWIDHHTYPHAAAERASRTGRVLRPNHATA
jgi:hypothetical protein